MCIEGNTFKWYHVFTRVIKVIAYLRKVFDVIAEEENNMYVLRENRLQNEIELQFS